VAVYHYTDAEGGLRFDVCRTADKQFPVRRPDKSKRYGWAWSCPEDLLVLYRLPKILAAAAAGEVIYVVEGEKDVHAIEAAGGVATCNPGGADRWRDDYGLSLKGAGAAFVVVDRDDAGRTKWAPRVVASLDAVGVEVFTVEAAEGKDAADHLAAGHTLEDFVHIELGDEPQDSPLIEESPVEDEKPLQLLRIEEATRSTDDIKALPPREPLIAGILDIDSMACTYGASAGGKTFLTLSQTLCIASATPWHGHEVTPGPVIYVVAEGAAGLGIRITAWEQHHGEPAYLHPVYWVTRPVSLFEPAWVGAFIEYAGPRRPVAVFFDTLARCTAGADESSARDMSIVVEHLDRIKRATGACVNVLHHTGKDQALGARGSSALRAGVDTEVEVKASDTRTTVSVTKQKDGAEAEPLHLERKVVGASCVLVSSSGRPSLSGKALDTLSALRRIELPGGVSAKEWRLASEMPERTFYDHRRLLLDCGQVRNLGTNKQPRYGTATVGEEEP
jgi:hypothetical protein